MFEHHRRQLLSGNPKGMSMSIQRSMLVAMALVSSFGVVQAQNTTESVQRRLEIDTSAQTTLDDLLKTQAGA
jgi:hypothetical protein